jgi:NTP pyrophosphatase (non-canonical NTP hydrolase)
VLKNQVPLEFLQKKVARFRDERKWKKHHNPKNLAISILVEAAELAEHFQWESMVKALAYKKDPAKKAKIAAELADVIIYCLSLADIMNIDFSRAITEKLALSEKKFPKEKAGDPEFVKLQRARYKFMEIGGALKSTVVLSDKQLNCLLFP